MPLDVTSEDSVQAAADSAKDGRLVVARALRREPADAAFPWPTATLVRLRRALPPGVSVVLLRKLAR